MAYQNQKVKARQVVTQTSQTQDLGIVSGVPMGDWSATAQYQKLNIVRYNRATYIAKKDSQGIEPAVAKGWQEVWQVVVYDGGVVSPDGNYPEMTVGNANQAISATNDSDGNNISDTYVKKSGGIIDGELSVKGRQWVHTANGAGGTPGYVQIAKITITKPYSDHPIVMVLTHREGERAKTVYIQFKNSNTTTPALGHFTYFGDNFSVYIKQDDTNKSVWYIYAQKGDQTDYISVLDCRFGGNNYPDIEWTNILYPTLPIDSIECIAIGEMKVQNSSGNTYFVANRTDTGTQIMFGIGSSGTSRGIWDMTLNKWVFNIDKDNNIFINGLKVNAGAYSIGTTNQKNQMDTVVEYYRSSDGSSWYRIWASGWKEAGIKQAQTQRAWQNITLPITFASSNYTILLGVNRTDNAVVDTDLNVVSARVTNVTTNGFNSLISYRNYTATGGSAVNDQTLNVYCCGY